MYSAEDNAAAARWALQVLSGDYEDAGAQYTLAHSYVLIPITADAAENGGALRLPVMDHGGRRQAVVFTSMRRMTAALPSIRRHRLVPLFVLADQWPSDGVPLAIDLGAPDALSLSAEYVQTMLTSTSSARA